MARPEETDWHYTAFAKVGRVRTCVADDDVLEEERIRHGDWISKLRNPAADWNPNLWFPRQRPNRWSPTYKNKNKNASNERKWSLVMIMWFLKIAIQAEIGCNSNSHSLDLLKTGQLSWFALALLDQLSLDLQHLRVQRVARTNEKTHVKQGNFQREVK